MRTGDDKDAGGEIVEIRDEVPELWLLEGSKRVFFQQPDIAALPRGDLTKCAAHWCGLRLCGAARLAIPVVSSMWGAV